MVGLTFQPEVQHVRECGDHPHIRRIEHFLRCLFHFWSKNPLLYPPSPPPLLCTYLLSLSMGRDAIRNFDWLIGFETCFFFLPHCERVSVVRPAVRHLFFLCHILQSVGFVFWLHAWAHEGDSNYLMLCVKPQASWRCVSDEGLTKWSALGGGGRGGFS